MTTNETNWVEKVGAPALASVREMVAAVACDYDRLQELRDERDNWEPAETCQNCRKETTWPSAGPKGERECKHCTAIVCWADANPEDAKELADLEEAAGDCESEDEARERIDEDPLSVEVRSGWTTPGEEMEAEEFCLLLSTGGPAVRIVGELDRGQPTRAWLEVQDWFEPWTQYHEEGAAEVCLAYAANFCFER